MSRTFLFVAACMAVVSFFLSPPALSAPPADVPAVSAHRETPPYEKVSRFDFLTGGVRIGSQATWFVDAVGWHWGPVGLRLLHLESAPEIPSEFVVSLAGVSLQKSLFRRQSYLVDTYALGLGPGGSVSEGEDGGGVLAQDDINFAEVGIRYARNFLSFSVGYRKAFVGLEWSDENASPSDRAEYDLTPPEGAFAAVSVGGHIVRNRTPHWWPAWDRTTQSNSPRDYLVFARGYPGTPKVEEALRRYAEMDDPTFASARRENTLASYDSYLYEYPDGRHLNDAREGKEALDLDAYGRAEIAGTPEAFRDYLATFPEGVRADDAKGGIERLAWDAALTLNSEDGFEAFLRDHPTGAHAQEALGQLEDMKWPVADAVGSLVAYREFLARFPNGRHAAEAIEKTDPLEWMEAIDSGSVEKYDAYLKNHPNGRFASECAIKRGETMRDLLARLPKELDRPPTNDEIRDAESIGYFYNWVIDKAYLVRKWK